MGLAIVVLLLALLVGAVVLGGVLMVHLSTSGQGAARHTSRTERPEDALSDAPRASAASRARSAASRLGRPSSPASAGTEREVERVAS